MHAGKESLVRRRFELKPFDIPKQIIIKAWEQVKAEQDRIGISAASMLEFDRDLDGNLHRLWIQLCSGTYRPPAVRAAPIAKHDARRIEILGVPTVADRIVRTIAERYLEPKMKSVFNPDAYHHRPHRSTFDAMAECLGTVLEE